MFFWFLGGTLIIVWFVFRSATLDYRLLGLGALIPLVEVVTGRNWILHTLIAPVGVLVVIMALTSKRRLVRRKWLCVPIGMFCHLVLDGVWTRAQLFWWPVSGFGFADIPTLEASRGLMVNVVLELVGLAVLVWGWQRFGLQHHKRRKLLMASGHLDRALVGPSRERA